MQNKPIEFIPVFVVGNSRTGTSMMARILGNHEDVFALLHELHFFEQMWSPARKNKAIPEEEAVRIGARLLGILNEGYLTLRDYRAYAADSKGLIEGHGGKVTAETVFANFIEHIARKEGKRYVCEQTPRNLFYVREIAEVFPQSKFINMVRDPRDVLLSQKKKWNVRYTGAKKYIPLSEAVRSWINYHPVTTSLLWKYSMRATEKLRGNPNTMVVKYEDVIENHGKEVKKVCDFIGIEYNEKLLEIPLVGSSLLKSALDRKGIIKRPVSRELKGLNKTEIFLCQLIAGPMMRAYGYEPIRVLPNFFVLLLYMFLLPVKLSAAFMANLRRMDSICSAISKRLN